MTNHKSDTFLMPYSTWQLCKKNIPIALIEMSLKPFNK